MLPFSAVERATYASKSLIIGLAVVKKYLTVEQAAHAASVEVNSQIERWGEVEDSRFFFLSFPIARWHNFASTRCRLPGHQKTAWKCSLSSNHRLTWKWWLICHLHHSLFDLRLCFYVPINEDRGVSGPTVVYSTMLLLTSMTTIRSQIIFFICVEGNHIPSYSGRSRNVILGLTMTRPR